jgi:hypothetical protein
MTRILRPVATVIATALALGACGSSSGSGVSAKTYVHTFCAAVAPFAQTIVTRTEALNLTSLRSPAQGKQVIHDYLASIESATSTTLTKLQSAGRPNVTNGQRISGDVLTAFTRLKATLQHAVSEANQLPTTSASALKAGTQRIDNDIKGSMSGISQSLATSTQKSPGLEKALAADSSCSALTGGA